MKKYSKIIIILIILLTIICFMFIRTIKNTNIFINYFILNYLEKMDKTMTDMSIQLNKIDNDEDFIDFIENYRESIKTDCFLSSKLKIINNNYNTLDLNDFSIYLLDILGHSDSLTEDDIKYHISNLKNICLIFRSLSDNPDFYTAADFSKNMGQYKIRLSYKVPEILSEDFIKIKDLAIKGSEHFN